MGMFDPIRPPKKHYHGPISIDSQWPGYREYLDLLEDWVVYVEYNGQRKTDVVYADPEKGVYMTNVILNGRYTLTAFSGHVEIVLERRK